MAKEDEVQRLTRELEDVKNFTDSIIQSIGSGILIARMNDAVTFINRAGERMLGYSKNELIGRPFSSLGLREKQGVVPSLLDTPEDLDTRKDLPDVPARRRISLMEEVLRKHRQDLTAGAIITVRGERIRISRTPA